MKQLAYVVAVPVTFHAFLESHAKALKSNYEITVITNLDGYELPEESKQFNFIHVPFARKIKLGTDLKTLWMTYRILRSNTFDIVHSVTPKVGLICGLAGVLARQNRRVHTFTGQVWASQHGARRWLLKMMDKLTHACATKALADSPSQVVFLQSEGFRKPIGVLANGSIAGVDSVRFTPSENVRRNVRSKLGLGEDEFVFCFLGRLNRDKGVLDLVDAFVEAELGPGHTLLIVGPDEECIAKHVEARAKETGLSVILVGPTHQPETFLSASDVFCLPSFREGFGTSVLEAAATGLPAIVSRIYGLTDAVDEGRTGLCHEPGNVAQISEALQRMAQDPELRHAMGNAAQRRARENFSLDRVTRDLATFYRGL